MFILNIIGNSNAGKDSFFKAFQKHCPTIENVKFNLFSKRAIALMYGVTVEQLEDKDFRKQLLDDPNPDGLTYGDILVRSFRYFTEMDKYIVIRPTLQTMRYLLDGKIPVATTDTRHPSEVLAMQQLDYPRFSIRLNRSQAKGAPSDCYLEQNWEYLENNSVNSWVLQNTTFDKLEMDAKSIAQQINYQLRMIGKCS